MQKVMHKKVMNKFNMFEIYTKISMEFYGFNTFDSEYLQTGTLANSEDSDKNAT